MEFYLYLMKMKNKKKNSFHPEVGIRWGRQQYRIEVVYLMLRYFSHYFMMKSYAECARHEKYDIKDAESLSSFISDAFKLDCKPEDFISTTNEMANKAIEEYKKLDEILNHYFPSVRFPIDREDVIATLAYLYNKSIILKMKHMDFLFFIKYVEYAYHTRTRGVKWLLDMSLETCIWNGGFTRHMDTMLFRKTFILIEEKLEQVIQKRLKRKNKKYGTKKRS